MGSSARSKKTKMPTPKGTDACKRVTQCIGYIVYVGYRNSRENSEGSTAKKLMR